MSLFNDLATFAFLLGALCWLSVHCSPSRIQTRGQGRIDSSQVSADRLVEKQGFVTSNVEATHKVSTAYRLRGITSETKQKEEVPSLLCRAWSIPESTKVTAHSLATDPNRPDSKIATVTFSITPEFLLSGNRTWWQSQVDNGLILDTHFSGFTPLHSDDDADCFLDCIAVSRGHAFGSFRRKGESFMWLRDALPKHLRQTRIFIYGYDSVTGDSDSFQSITDFGMKLQEAISGLRPGGKDSSRPLILIGHSLGGLILKQALINMHESPQEGDKMNLESLRAVFFFGVPNLGMNVESFIPMSEGKPSEQLVKSLQSTAETLRWQQKHFKRFSQKFSRYWYYETKMSPTAQKVRSKWTVTGPLVTMVDIHSATNGLSQPSERDGHYVYPVNRTHSAMVKFPHEQDEDFWMVCTHLNRVKEEVLKNKGMDRLSPITSELERARPLAIENRKSRQTPEIPFVDYTPRRHSLDSRTTRIEEIGSDELSGL